MKHIIKTSPPDEFVKECETPGVSFSTLRSKKTLKERLLQDQGFICCYCGCEIKNDGHTKIEHIKCQERHEDLALCFENMLASCDGGENDRKNKVVPPHVIHCDAKKGSDDIPISPLEKDVENCLMYFDDGTVKGSDPEGNGSKLIQVLGLNVAYLVTQRKNAIEAYEDFGVTELEKELNWIKDKHNGKYEPFCFVLEQYIKSIIDSFGNGNSEELEGRELLAIQ